MSIDPAVVNKLLLSLGALGLFLLGIKLASEGLRGALGGYLKHLLALLTRNRLSAVGAGAIITFALSSSSASTALLMGLVDAGLLGVRQTLGVLLGSGIGTALTVQVIALDVGAAAGALVALGVGWRLFARYRRSQNLANALIGLGLLFLGITLMRESMAGVLDAAVWRDHLRNVLVSPVTGTIAATIFTALVQSSAATIAFGFVLVAPVAAGGAGFSLEGVLPLILGANLGTCATALFASVGCTAAGRQVAVAQLLFKLIGVVLALSFLPEFAALAQEWSALVGVQSAAREVAWTHTMFNVLLAVALLPLLGAFAAILRWLVPRHLRLPPGVLEAIRASDWDEPDRALDNAHQEIVGLGRRALRLVSECWPAIRDDRDHKLDDLVADDDVIDLTQDVLTGHLTKVEDARLEPRQGEFKRKLLHCLWEWETIGDIVSKDLVALGRKKIDSGLTFTGPMARDLERLHGTVLESFERTIKFFDKGNRRDADHVLRREAVVDAAQRRIYNAQLERLTTGTDVEAEATGVFVDLVAAVRTIHRHLLDVVRGLSRTAGTDQRSQPPRWPVAPPQSVKAEPADAGFTAGAPEVLDVDASNLNSQGPRRAGTP